MGCVEGAKRPERGVPIAGPRPSGAERRLDPSEVNAATRQTGAAGTWLRFSVRGSRHVSAIRQQVGATPSSTES